MRSQANRLVPAVPFKDLLSDGDLAAYHARTSELAPADLLAWLHR
jgi:hypothetical protein